MIKLLLESEMLTKQINELKSNDMMKRYFDLCKKNEQLASQQKDLYKQIKKQEYSSCNHIWVNTFHEYDSFEGHYCDYYGCIKCGLDESIYHLIKNCHHLECFTLEQQTMYEFIRDNVDIYHTGINSKVLCNLDLAKAVYSRIKEVHPYIDDEMVRKYFEIAICNIKETKVNDARKVSREKRLSLNPKFNKC